jgi:hypothetical protein
MYKHIIWRFPILEIASITGGKNIAVTIKNVGDGVATDVHYSIEITGGFIIKPRNSSGTLDNISADESRTFTMNVTGIGIGVLYPMPVITIRVSCIQGDHEVKSLHAAIFFRQVKILD